MYTILYQSRKNQISIKLNILLLIVATQMAAIGSTISVAQHVTHRYTSIGYGGPTELT